MIHPRYNGGNHVAIIRNGAYNIVVEPDSPALSATLLSLSEERDNFKVVKRYSYVEDEAVEPIRGAASKLQASDKVDMDILLE